MVLKLLPTYMQVLQSMGSVKWDIREIMSQHDAYVDLLLQVLYPVTLYTVL